MALSVQYRKIFSIGLAITVVLWTILHSIRKLSLGDAYKHTMQLKQRFDQLKAANGESYPVCRQLKELECGIKGEEKYRETVNAIYGLMLKRDELHCGRVRSGMGIFEKKIPILRKDCVPGILPAKKRLLQHLQAMCYVQDRANSYFFHNLSSSSDKVSGDSSREPTGSSLSVRPAAAWNSYSGGQLFHSNAVVSRGLLFTGAARHFKKIFQSIYALRLLNVSLPVEIWVNERDEYLCEGVLELLSQVRPLWLQQQHLPTQILHEECKSMPDSIGGFASKFYALLSTSFTDVIFLDADNLAVQNVEKLFESKEYKTFGAVLWPDLGGESCRNAEGISSIDATGYTGYRTHVLWQSRMGGLQWEDNYASSHEAETGQLVVDLRRHAAVLELGRKLMEDRSFFVKVVNGDKDIFRLIFLLVGEPFYFVPKLPALSTNGKDRDCIVQYWHGSPGNPGFEPMFFHQLKIRDPKAFTAVWTLPSEYSEEGKGLGIDHCINVGTAPSPTLPNADRKTQSGQLNASTENRNRFLRSTRRALQGLSDSEHANQPNSNNSDVSHWIHQYKTRRQHAPVAISSQAQCDIVVPAFLKKTHNRSYTRQTFFSTKPKPPALHLEHLPHGDASRLFTFARTVFTDVDRLWKTYEEKYYYVLLVRRLKAFLPRSLNL